VNRGDDALRRQLIARAQAEIDAAQHKFDQLLKELRQNSSSVREVEFGWMCKTWPNLQMQMGVGSDGASRLAESLQGNQFVTAIDLTGNSIGDRGAQRLALALSKQNNVTQIDLSGNSLTAVAGYWLGRTLACGCKLRHIELSFNALGDEGVAHLLDGLNESKAFVVSMGLSGNKITAGNAALRMLRAIVKLNSSLQHPHLSQQQQQDATEYRGMMHQQRPPMSLTLPSPPAYVTGMFPLYPTDED